MKKGVAIFEKLSKEDQQTILVLLQGKEATKISSFLTHTGLVHDNHIGLSYWNTIKDQLIPNTSKEQNIDLLLTDPERDILELLQEHKDIVTREKVATTLWQDAWEEKYSDWAIDQLVHRIREKLEKTQAPYEIVTKKGEGFYLRAKDA